MPAIMKKSTITLLRDVKNQISNIMASKKYKLL